MRKEILRSIPYYEKIKNGVTGTLNILGQTTGKPIESLNLDYKTLSTIHTSSVIKYSEELNLTNKPLILKAVQDSIFREGFNTGAPHEGRIREINRFGKLGIRELHLSYAKALANSRVAKHDSKASFGLGNVKPYRIPGYIFEAFPADIKSSVAFDYNAGHVTPESLAAYLTPPSIELAYQRSIGVYMGIGKANEELIIESAKAYNYLDWQTRYIASTIICCSDPVNIISSAESVGDYGYSLLAKPKLADVHFTEYGDFIQQVQKFSDRFFEQST